MSAVSIEKMQDEVRKYEKSMEAEPMLAEEKEIKEGIQEGFHENKEN